MARPFISARAAREARENAGAASPELEQHQEHAAQELETRAAFHELGVAAVAQVAADVKRAPAKKRTAAKKAGKR